MKKIKLKTVDDYLEFVKSIPPKEWCIRTFNNAAGQHCLVGHLARVQGSTWSESNFGNAIVALNRVFPISHIWTQINDGDDVKFPQKTIRGRVLAAMRKYQRDKKK